MRFCGEVVLKPLPLLCYVHVLAEVGFYVQLPVKNFNTKTIAGKRRTLLLNVKPARMSVKTYVVPVQWPTFMV